MNDNINIIKVLIVIFSPFFAIKFLNEQNIFFCLYCIIPWLMLIVHLCRRFGNYIDNSFVYTYDYANDSFWKKAEDNSKKIINEVSQKCIINKNVVQMESLNSTTTITNLPPIKDVVAMELEKKNAEKILDGTKANKPTIDMDKLTTPPPIPSVATTTTNTSTMSSFAKEAILVENSNIMTIEKTGTYKTIINVLESNEKLSPDQKYVLYQSFSYIDVNKAGIVIYIDYDILKKANLTKEHLHQEEIIKALKTAMHCEELMVIFDEYKPKNLLNYFIETKCYAKS